MGSSSKKSGSMPNGGADASKALTQHDRERLLRQKGCVVWITGLSAAGKSTIAQNLEIRLHEQRHSTYLLDADDLRRGLNQNLGFTPADRHENVRRMGEAAKLLSDAGIIAIVACISPYAADRDRIREMVGPSRFIEIYLSTPLSVCEMRDPKGLYKRAREGRIGDFTGISSPYEIPQAPDLELDTGKFSIAVCVEKVLQLVSARALQKSESSSA